MIQELFVYPIKSCRGIKIQSTKVLKNGFEFDRNWMIVDEKNIFLSQRKLPQMALISVELKPEKLRLSFPGFTSIEIDLDYMGEIISCTVWKSNVRCYKYSSEINNWLSQCLGVNCSLVKIESHDARIYKLSTRELPYEVTFADSAPVLIANRKSFDAFTHGKLNSTEILRLRPNIIVETPVAFEEFQWKHLQSKSVGFEVLGPCTRCTLIEVDQNTGEKGLKFFKSLSDFLKENGHAGAVDFGMKLIPKSEGFLAQGDEIRMSLKA